MAEFKLTNKAVKKFQTIPF